MNFNIDDLTNTQKSFDPQPRIKTSATFDQIRRASYESFLQIYNGNRLDHSDGITTFLRYHNNDDNTITLQLCSNAATSDMSDKKYYYDPIAMARMGALLRKEGHAVHIENPSKEGSLLEAINSEYANITTQAAEKAAKEDRYKRF